MVVRRWLGGRWSGNLAARSVRRTHIFREANGNVYMTKGDDGWVRASGKRERNVPKRPPPYSGMAWQSVSVRVRKARLSCRLTSGQPFAESKHCRQQNQRQAENPNRPRPMDQKLHDGGWLLPAIQPPQT